MNKDLPAWGSKKAVNRAGGALRANILTPEHERVFEVWRIGHKHVINNFKLCYAKGLRTKTLRSLNDNNR
jgi:hypothetical protein